LWESLGQLHRNKLTTLPSAIGQPLQQIFKVLVGILFLLLYFLDLAFELRAGVAHGGGSLGLLPNHRDVAPDAFLLP